MALSPKTALRRLRKLYSDAHHCQPPTDQHALNWAAKPELWAENQIRFCGWSWYATESTVRSARQLHNRLKANNLPIQQEVKS
jgi:hypothetical protein